MSNSTAVRDYISPAGLRFVLSGRHVAGKSPSAPNAAPESLTLEKTAKLPRDADCIDGILFAINQSGQVVKYNTLVELYTGGGRDVAGSVAGSNNLIGVPNPGLVPAQASNGGPTQTIALFSNSPAVGAGSATIAGVTIPAVDQRGIARPATGFNIGAYQGSVPAPVNERDGSVECDRGQPLDLCGASVRHGERRPSSTAPRRPSTGGISTARGHQHAKAAHPVSMAHQPARVASPARRTVSVWIAEHRRGGQRSSAHRS